MVNITKKIKVTTLPTTFFYLIKLGNGLRLLFTFVLSVINKPIFFGGGERKKP